MRQANYNDICMELWVRERNERQIQWKTKSGELIPIRDMTTEHLKNILNIGDDCSCSSIEWFDWIED
jgi:hypothetical protein